MGVTKNSRIHATRSGQTAFLFVAILLFLSRYAAAESVIQVPSKIDIPPEFQVPSDLLIAAPIVPRTRCPKLSFQQAFTQKDFGLETPHSVALKLDSDKVEKVYVVDTGYSRITGSTVDGTRERPSLRVDGPPRDATIDQTTGDIYVTVADYRDETKSGIVKMDKTGKVLETFKNVDLVKPYGIKIGPDDKLYVVDIGVEGVVVLERKPEMKVTNTLTDWPPGYSINGTALKSRIPGGGVAVAFNPSGTSFYVTDIQNHQVLVFSSTTGRVIRKWFVRWPYGVAVDAYGDVYVTQHMTLQQLFRFSSTGELIEVVAEYLPKDHTNPASIYDARQLKFAGDCNLYFADGGQNRIVRFAPSRN